MSIHIYTYTHYAVKACIYVCTIISHKYVRYPFCEHAFKSHNVKYLTATSDNGEKTGPALSYRFFAIFILNAYLQFFFSYSVQLNKHYTLLIWPFGYKPPSVDHADWFSLQIGSVCCEKRLCADWFHQETTLSWLLPLRSGYALIGSTQKRLCADWFYSEAAMRSLVRLRGGYALIGSTKKRLCAEDY